MKKIFTSMAGGAFAIPSLILLPLLFAVFIGVGLTRDDILEDEVYQIWARRNSKHFADMEYARSVGAKAGASSLLAMAKTRNEGENIMTKSNLEEVRERMEKMESVTVEYNGNTFDWKDVCASNNLGPGTVYQFPCVRLTPMDLYKEARWYMTETDRLTWYEKGIQANVIKPRIPRFGIMQNDCATATQCGPLLQQRISSGEALLLFGDLTAMSMSDPCRICIETTFEARMEQGAAGVTDLFGLIAQHLSASAAAFAAVPETQAKMLEIAGKASSIYTKMSENGREMFEEFTTYYTTRALYTQLGAEQYLSTYNDVHAAVTGVGGTMTDLTTRLLEFVAQPSDLADPVIFRNAGAAVAAKDLAAHADGSFWSVNTAGNPYPFEIPAVTPAPGFKSPVGGSGLDLSGQILSMSAHLDAGNAGNLEVWAPGSPDPNSDGWINLVESDPIYKWFMAGEEETIAGCGNIQPNPLLLPSTWCTIHNEPRTEFGPASMNKLHFVKMWYNLLLDNNFLGITQGEDDPYSWTNGNGCGYDLGGERYSYNQTDVTESDILKNSSRDLYFLDEGSSIGALDKSLLLGGANSDVNGTYESVTTFQNIYPMAIPENVIERVSHCNRPGGGIDITTDDAVEILESFKRQMVDIWSEGWDDSTDGNVQFTAFFDSVGTAGTFNFTLREISDDSSFLTFISILIIAGISMAFLFNCNMVKSRMGVTLVGVILVVLSFVGSLGFAVLVGLKINLNMAWTLPFIMIGLGVDDMYIVLSALNSRRGNEKEDFVEAMQEVVAPVTMTSLINFCMFAVMNIIDIGAIYVTAQAAMISVFFLYISIVFCFPTYCYFDMKRQEAHRLDIAMCVKRNSGQNESEEMVKSEPIVFKIYKNLFLTKTILAKILQLVVVLGAIALMVAGGIGIKEREVGVGIEEFFPSSHQGNRWAEIRNTDLASWPMGMSWGKVDYTDPDVQLKMMKQFEDVIALDYVSEKDTKWLWISEFNLWTTKHCDANFVRNDPNVLQCGADQIYTDEDGNDSTCEGSWVENTIGLKTKSVTNIFSDQCSPFEGGVCREANEMFVQDIAALGLNETSAEGKSFCPITENWSEDKLKFCIEKWRLFTGGSGGLIVAQGTDYKLSDGEVCEGEYNNDGELASPIEISASPTLYAVNLFSHQDTVNMIEQTRAVCDDDESIHCFMTGIPFDFWEQYLTVNETLLTMCAVAVATGLVVATAFLFLELDPVDESFTAGKKIVASAFGGIIIAFIILLSLIPVIGISLLLRVNLTAFSIFSFVLSVAYATEFSVHVVHRFLSAPLSIESAEDRVEYTMKFLAQPLTLSFVSSAVGIACLAFTRFEFNERDRKSVV